MLPLTTPKQSVPLDACHRCYTVRKEPQEGVLVRIPARFNRQWIYYETVDRVGKDDDMTRHPKDTGNGCIFT